MNDMRRRPTQTRLGKVIREELARLDRGQAWLGRQLDTPEQRVSEWVLGIHEPNTANLIALAKALGVPLAKLAGAVGGRKRRS